MHKSMLIEKQKTWSQAIVYCDLVLSILVVAVHVDFSTSASGSIAFSGIYYAFNYVVNIIAACATPAFFIISAYLAFRNYSIKNYPKFLIKKFRSCVIPYILWSSLGYIYMVVVSILKNERVGNLTEIIMAVNNPPIWFLRTLFLFMLLSPILYFLCLSKVVSIMIILGGMIFNLNFKCGYTSIIFWLPMWVIGGSAGVHLKQKLETGTNKIRTLIFVPISVLAVAVCFGVYTVDTPLYYLYRVVSGVTVIAIFLLIPWKKDLPQSFQHSFITFCSHALLLGIGGKVYTMAFSFNGITLIIGHIFCTFSIWATTIILAEITKRNFPTLFSILSGKRKCH